jgi:hypothetical protein
MAPDAAWFEAEKAITVDGWRTVARHAVTVQIAGARHMSFMDVPFLPITDASPVIPMLAATTIDPSRNVADHERLPPRLFAEHLDGVPAPLLSGPSAAYPEVRYGAP